MNLKPDLDIPLIRTTKKAVLTIQDGFKVSDDAYFAFATSVSLARNHPPRRRRKASPVVTEQVTLDVVSFWKTLIHYTVFLICQVGKSKNMKKWWIFLEMGM